MDNNIKEVLGAYRVILAPSFTLAENIHAEATVEAEYGKECVEGSMATLAHHGPRSGNPAPCNTDVDVLPKGSTILLSHIDLDAVGGVMALTGTKPADEAFWKAAEFIDVHGPQHTWELPQPEQDKLNAIWAWNSRQPRGPRLTEVTDVSDKIAEYAGALSVLLGERTPEQEKMLADGREWAESTAKDVESCLVAENENVRVFVTRDDGSPFCCGSYYSPSMGKPAKACVQLNPKMNAITLSFYDGGAELSAEKIMQEVYGPKAGGRAGIAGTPRGGDAPLFSKEDALELASQVDQLEKMIGKPLDTRFCFVVPENNLEARRIIKILREHGFMEGENLFISGQKCGASWDGLEDEIKQALSALDPDKVYGIELQGDSPFHNIDHHIYEGDDRSNPLSSIEQVAALIGYKLTDMEQFIAANDKGHIPAMEKLAEEKGIEPDAARGVYINTVRRMDRAAQGITQEQEDQAETAIENRERKNGYDVVHLPHSKCATVTDRLYGRYDNLLIVCGDGELDFYGKGSICRDLQKELGGWAGGDLDKNGFWGGFADPEKTAQIIAHAVAPTLDLNHKDQRTEICLAAVKQNAQALNYAEELTPEICLAAVQQNDYDTVSRTYGRGSIEGTNKIDTSRRPRNTVAAGDAPELSPRKGSVIPGNPESR